MTKADDLIVEISADLTRLERGLTDAARAVERGGKKMERTAKRAERQFSALSKSAQRLATGLIAVAAPAVMGNFVSRTLDAVKRTGELAAQANTSVERLQSLRFAMTQSGGAASDMDEALRRLNRRTGLFVNDGAGPAKAAFEALGISVRDLRPVLGDSAAVLDMLLPRLQQYKTDAELAAAASAFFGEDAGPRLVQFLRQGAEETRKLEEAARDLGLVLAEDTVKAATAASDKLDALSQVLSARWTAVIADNAQAIHAVADGLFNVVDAAGQATTAVGKFLKAIDRSREEEIARLETVVSATQVSMLGRLFALHPGSPEARAIAQLESLLQSREDDKGLASVALGAGVPSSLARPFEGRVPFRQGLASPSFPFLPVAKPQDIINRVNDRAEADARAESQRVADERSARLAGAVPTLAPRDRTDFSGLLARGTGSIAVAGEADKLRQSFDSLTPRLEWMAESTGGFASLVDSVAAGSMARFEDGLIRLAEQSSTLGEFFKSLSASILRDTGAQLVSQSITGPLSAALAGGIGGLFGPGPSDPSNFAALNSISSRVTGVSYNPARARGGPVRPGIEYLVGERGPERVRFGAPGFVSPSHAMPASSSTVHSPITITAPGADRFTLSLLRREVEALRRDVPRLATGAVRDQMYRQPGFGR